MSDDDDSPSPDKIIDEVAARLSCSLFYLARSRLGSPHAYVVENRISKQMRVLKNDRDAGKQMIRIKRPNVLSSDQDSSGFDGHRAWQSSIFRPLTGRQKQ
jgi:hypothetical protein